ncbi:MAG: hypothetical protein K8T90_02635 [Planctomycetes bacterium]|nr:hypothetical protein [Planctomycetota bacterium]
MNKFLSVLALTFAVVAAGCDAGVASSNSGASAGSGPAACPTMNGGGHGCPSEMGAKAAGDCGECPSAAAKSAVNPACPDGSCDYPGDCGKSECEPKNCEEMKKDCPSKKAPAKAND